MRAGSLFAGYGGLDLAVNAYFGATTAWFSEFDTAPSRILAHHWPDTPNHGDITRIDWNSVEPVDILTGGFPCFTADVPVLTTRGFIPIQDVEVDDLVLTHRNRWRKVTATMNRQVNEVVEFAPGMFATPEHRFYTRQPGRRWDNDARSYRRTLGDTEWTEAQNLASQFVARPINIPSPTNEIRKPITPPGMTWWQVGRWLADGWTSGPEKRVVCVAVGGAKVDDLDRFPGWKVAEQRTAHRAYICNKATADWLTSEFGSGAYGKTVPAWALWMPIADRRELLEGYWSGDAYRQGASIRSTSVSPTLVVGIRALAESCGYSTSLSYTRTPDTTVIEGRTVNQRNWWRLDARSDYGRYTERDGVFTWSKVRKLGKTITGPTTVYDLTVDEDHSFTAAGIVVHNCQDVSAAGRRAGIRDGTRSGLWSYFAEAINQLRPKYVVIENVRGLLSAEAHRVESDPDAVGDGSSRPILRALGAVLGDLSDIGYDAQWTTVAAASVGACHRRERVFILATPADAERGGCGGDARASRRGPGRRATATGGCEGGNRGDAVSLLPTPRTSDTNGPGAHGDGGLDLRTAVVEWGDYEPAIRRAELACGRLAPSPTEPNRNGNPRLSARFAEWMMMLPDGWVTDPAIGLSRNEQLKAIGNGVVPAQAYAALTQLVLISLGVA